MPAELLALLKDMVANCPVCRGKGEVKKWEALDPETKQPTGLYKGMKSCPYCGKARKVLNAKEEQK